LRRDGPQIFRTKAVFALDGQRLVASFHHVATQHTNGRVTHVLFDLREQRIVGEIDMHTHLTGFRSTACCSADGRRLTSAKAIASTSAKSRDPQWDV